MHRQVGQHIEGTGRGGLTGLTLQLQQQLAVANTCDALHAYVHSSALQLPSSGVALSTVRESQGNTRCTAIVLSTRSVLRRMAFVTCRRVVRIVRILFPEIYGVPAEYLGISPPFAIFSRTCVRALVCVRLLLSSKSKP